MGRALMGVVLVAACTVGESSPRDGGVSSAFDAARPDAGGAGDGGVDATLVDGSGYDPPDPDAGDCAPSSCEPIAMGCTGVELCDNGLDDDCDVSVDEGCACETGRVQDCLLAPPGARGVGACRTGTQRCVEAFEFSGYWGPCEAATSPSTESCNGLDDDCNGCTDEVGCCDVGIRCPGPGDPRVPDGAPFREYVLRGADFVDEPVTRWRWTVEGGPCDSLLPEPTFAVDGTDRSDLSFTPTLSGDYRVTLEVTLADGTVRTCEFFVHIAGLGLRVELCWRSEVAASDYPADLDLYLHDPRTTDAWFTSNLDPYRSTGTSSCNWTNCAANLRGTIGGAATRVDWGYASSPLSECENGPQGDDWRAIGRCHNPRIDVDSVGIPGLGPAIENINVDVPRDMERFRVMVNLYFGELVTPIVNVYCGGRLRGSFGVPPDAVPDFRRRDLPPEVVSTERPSVGPMWRVADVTTRVDAAGVTTDCTIEPLRDPATGVGYFVTHGDPAY